MPHLTTSDIDSIESGRKPVKPGDLTYIFYREGVQYIVRNGRSFSNYCIVMGALFCAALELYRLKVSKYEDTKIAENGEALANLG